jgi:hypothetical protein
VRRGYHPPLYLLTGLVIGIVAGLVIVLTAFPVNYIDTAPHALRSGEKENYRRLIALAFQANQDIGRARARLEILAEPNPASTLAAQANKVLASGDSPQDAQALDRLSKSLVQQLPATPTPFELVQSETESAITQTDTVMPLETFDPNQAVRTPTALTPFPNPSEPAMTFTPRWVTPTPLPALNAAFILQKKSQVCDPKNSEAMLQVEVIDKRGKSLPGAHITVTWKDGEDVFFTGLHPAINAGYADFTMTADLTYSLRVGEGGQLVEDLSPVNCISDDGKAYLGGWALLFSEP